VRRGDIARGETISCAINIDPANLAKADLIDADETHPNDKQIPYKWTRQKLAKYLREHFDLSGGLK